MPKGRRTSYQKAALAMELRENEGRSEREISDMTGVSPATIHTILSRANGWGDIAENETFKRHRLEQTKVLEQAYRTMAAECVKKAWGKMDQASFAQLIFASGIALDKSRLLGGEPTEITASVNLHAIGGLDQLASKLSQVLLKRGQEARLVNGDDPGSDNQGSTGGSNGAGQGNGEQDRGDNG